jgi:hypothetical protein
MLQGTCSSTIRTKIVWRLVKICKIWTHVQKDTECHCCIWPGIKPATSSGILLRQFLLILHCCDNTWEEGRNFTKLQSLSSYLLQKGWPEQLQEKWSWTWNSCSLLNHAICFLWASSLGNLTSPCCSTYPKNFTLLCFLVHPSAFSTSDSRNKLLCSWCKLSLLVSFYFPVSFLVNCISPSFFILTVSCTWTFLEPLLESSLQQEEKTVTHIQNNSWWIWPQRFAQQICEENMWDLQKSDKLDHLVTLLPLSWHFMLRMFWVGHRKTSV